MLRKLGILIPTINVIYGWHGTLSPPAVFRARAGFAGRIVGASANLEDLPVDRRLPT